MHTIRLHAGMSVGRYEVVRCIGSGAVGTVYEAVHRPLGRHVALKVLHGLADAELADRIAERFLREGRAAARVRHAHVIDVYDFGVEAGLPFLAMELVEGESLAQLLRREGRLSQARAVEIMLPILSAVAELHAAGIVHRDIKPANILLARDGQAGPKLADFGVSRFDDGSPTLTRSGTLIGTPAYMAPETLRAKAAASEPSDQYALGVSLYECVTGVRPFRGSTDYELMHAIVRAVPRRPSSLEPSLPERLDSVVMRAMHREPHRRFASVDCLAAAVLPFASASVSARWRSEFVAPGLRLGREENVSKWHPMGALGPRMRHRLAAGLGAVLGVIALSTFAMGKRPAPSAAKSAETAPVAPDAHAATAWTVPEDPAGEGVPASAATPDIPSPRINVRKRAPSSKAAAAGAAPATGDSTPTLGENEAPILEVP